MERVGVKPPWYAENFATLRRKQKNCSPRRSHTDAFRHVFDLRIKVLSDEFYFNRDLISTPANVIAMVHNLELDRLAKMNQ